MNRLKTYFRYSLPALFTLYIGFLIAFTHVHIVNGVTIVHSHPYQNSENGGPAEHEHTYAEFQLLHQISTIQIAGPLVILFLLTALFTQIHTVQCNLTVPAYHNPVRTQNYLRGPPAVF
ncbi:MAG: hypothetical protein LUH10_07320 [Tannerellaceae bacterium]|nr:hypothetical protein [Tannerellaceae bacterium]